jgi:hypothetical protein
MYMEQLMQKDLYLEHRAGFHKGVARYRMQSKCSDCYAERQAILEKSQERSANRMVIGQGGFQEAQAMDRHITSNPYN